jgi:hypothetical protein
VQVELEGECTLWKQCVWQISLVTETLLEFLTAAPHEQGTAHAKVWTWLSAFVWSPDGDDWEPLQQHMCVAERSRASLSFLRWETLELVCVCMCVTG